MKTNCTQLKEDFQALARQQRGADFHAGEITSDGVFSCYEKVKNKRPKPRFFISSGGARLGSFGYLSILGYLGKRNTAEDGTAWAELWRTICRSQKYMPVRRWVW